MIDEDLQAKPCEKIEVNNSIEENASETIGKTASNQIELIAIEQKYIARNQVAYIPHFKFYINNISKLLTTIFGKCPLRNLMTEQLA